jgi:soluble lytic murein transglycosylase
VAEALAELNALRYDLRFDPVSSYQLALAFRDMGVFRSSILAASTVIRLSPGGTWREVPRFLARLAYPAYYLDLVLRAAEEHALDPLLLLAAIRQESLFESAAQSWAAAQGLMQVIPSTGEYIASSLRWPNYQNQHLYRPYVSVAFGSYYLAQQLGSFDNDVYAALSAYNGGPGNAARWWAASPRDPDHYLEVVTLAETRSYIQLIYLHYAAYRELYGTER